MRLFTFLLLVLQGMVLYSQITIDVDDGFILKDLQWQNKPSNHIYKDWNNQLVNPYPGIQMYLGDTINLNLISDSTCSFTRPCSGIITSGFGWRAGTAHVGIDLDLETGDTVVSAFDGIVRVASWVKGYGNCVIIRHYNGLESLYGHMSKLLVVSGQHVNSGNYIGLGGNTGYSHGSHLHFELRLLGRPLDARDFIDFNTGTLKDPVLKLSKLEFEKRYGQSAIRKKIIKSNIKRKKSRKRKKSKPYSKKSTATSKPISKNISKKSKPSTKASINKKSPSKTKSVNSSHKKPLTTNNGSTKTPAKTNNTKGKGSSKTRK